MKPDIINNKNQIQFMDSESEGKPEVNTKEKWMENQNGNVKIWFQSNRTQKRTDSGGRVQGLKTKYTK